eukprot:178536-Chlamydomonas_euryale.AAC.1
MVRLSAHGTVVILARHFAGRTMRGCNVLRIPKNVSSRFATSSCAPAKRTIPLTASLRTHSHASRAGTVMPAT